MITGDLINYEVHRVGLCFDFRFELKIIVLSLNVNACIAFQGHVTGYARPTIKPTIRSCPDKGWEVRVWFLGGKVL